MGRLRETKAEHLPFLVFLHHVLLQAGPATRDMGDAALLHVAETTLRNLETRASGILYDHQVERADLQPLVEWMTELILQRSKVQLAPKLDDAGATHVLETVVEAIRGHAGGEEPKQYLDVAARVFAPLLAQAPSLELPPPPKPSAGLILPP